MEKELTIGEMLKEVRIEKKKSFEDAFEKTKISKKYLRALEENNFSCVPEEVHLRGFLKTYADYLGLDPKIVLSKLDVLKRESELSQERPRESKEEGVGKTFWDIRNIRDRWGYSLWILLAVIILYFIIRAIF